MRSYRSWSLLALTLVILAAGCEEEEIREYRAPKPDPAFHRQPSSLRLIVAIVKRADVTWFYKLLGPESVVAQQIPIFEQLVATARYDARAPRSVTWDKLPPRWTAGRNTSESVRAFQVGPEEHPAHFTATPFEEYSGRLLDDVNRWRTKHFGIAAPIEDDDLPDYYRETTADGQKITWVEMSGGKPVKR